MEFHKQKKGAGKIGDRRGRKGGRKWGKPFEESAIKEG